MKKPVSKLVITPCTPPKIVFDIARCAYVCFSKGNKIEQVGNTLNDKNYSVAIWMLGFIEQSTEYCLAKHYPLSHQKILYSSLKCIFTCKLANIIIFLILRAFISLVVFLLMLQPHGFLKIWMIQILIAHLM